MAEAVMAAPRTEGKEIWAVEAQQIGWHIFILLPGMEESILKQLSGCVLSA